MIDTMEALLEYITIIQLHSAFVLFVSCIAEMAEVQPTKVHIWRKKDQVD